MSGWFVKSNDIKLWTTSNKRRAEEVLPLLVKNLIQASSNPKEVIFPSGDTVATGGWDGLLEVKEGNEFVPTGKSGWEFGTNSDINNKADGDYQKRTQKPETLTPLESTFVFVTSRPWLKKNTWLTEKRAIHQWKDVQGINADDLESWLELCPAVHRWFANLIGKTSGELWDLEQAWGALANVSGLSLTPELFLTSRKEQAKLLLTRLSGESSLLKVAALSEREAYGFILACLKSKGELTARVLIVKNQTTWDQLMESKYSLILIPQSFSPGNIGNAVSKGHSVVLALDKRSSVSSDIKLARISRQDRITSIQSLGLAEDQSEKVYNDTKGYFEPILRHYLLKPIDRPRPSWADSSDTDTLFASLFATEWDSTNDADKDIMSALSGIDYQDFERHLYEITKEADSPLRLVGNVWQVISKIDMWLLIAPHLRKTHLERLGSIIKQALSDPDPAYDLPPNERYLAGIKGAKPIYSRRLKSGLANSCALLAAFGDDYSEQCGAEMPSNLVRYWVSQVFEDSIDAKKCFSLGHTLQSIAEAAPEEFLKALEKSLQGEGPLIAQLFEIEGNEVFGGCPHADLLWSIELVSWNPEYLARTALCLARLSEIDPGGRWSNRPINSLVDIFLGWINNTQANKKQRLEIIEKVLLANHSDIAWGLMVSLLLKNSRFTSGVNKPEYRDWAENVEETISTKSYYEYVDAIVDILFKAVEQDLGKRLPDLIANFDSYSESHREDIIRRMLNIDPKDLLDEDRDKVVIELRRQISHHRQFPKADWAWPMELVDKLEIVYHKFEFEDAIKNNIYLFNSYNPDLVQPSERGISDWREEEKLIAGHRVKTLEGIFKIKGISGIKDLTLRCNNPELVGLAIFQSSLSGKVVPYILDWLGSECNLKLAAQYYISARSTDDWGWTIRLFNKNKPWDETKKADFLLSLPTCSKMFDLVEDQDQPIQHLYWSDMNRYFLQSEEKNKTSYVASKLLEYNRPLAAIDAAAQQFVDKNGTRKVDCELIATILMRIATDPSDAKRISINTVQYDITSAIEYIQDCAELPIERIAQIEFLFLPIFHERIKPRYLNGIMINDPSFFVQLLKWQYKRRDGVVENRDSASDELKKQRATASFELFRSISILPGDTGAVIDQEKLDNWVDQARKLSSEAGRGGIGDHQIGNYLGHCSGGADGIWPHEAVRNVIERVKSSEMERGLAISRFNSRGIVSRGIYDGGRQEKELAARYRDNAHNLELSFPRTASILRELADDYDRHAHYEDREVDLGL